MDYEIVSEAISCSFCSECRACFPELADFCDTHQHLITDDDNCKKVVRKYLVLKVEGRYNEG